MGLDDVASGDERLRTLSDQPTGTHLERIEAKCIEVKRMETKADQN